MDNPNAHKLNIMVDGTCVSETVFADFESMMDAARAARDEVATNHPGGFVVAQYQRTGPHGWYHGAILS